MTQALPAGTVTIATLERRGSQSDTKPSGETRRIIYYDTELKLERDFDFGAWDSPASPASCRRLAQGPKASSASRPEATRPAIACSRMALRFTSVKAISGLRRVRGLRSDRRSRLRHAAPQGGAIGMIDQMRTVVQNVPKDLSPAARALIEQELAAANAAIRAAVARATQGYAIAAGAEHGQYYRFAQALADPKGIRIVPLITRGGEENLRMLREARSR